MIPTWNPHPEFLKETIDSVLKQDLGALKMQIAVVDDCSTEIDVESILESWNFHHRLEFYQNETNRGIGGNWNSCIEHSRGEYLHILHQDDLVLEGFYDEYLKVIRTVKPKAIFGRVEFEKESKNKFSPIVQPHTGFIEADLETFTTSIVFQCPTVVIKKEVYDDLGDFDESLKYSVDRDMWIRIAANYNFYYINKVLSVYRIGDHSATSRLVKSGEQLIDSFRGVKKFISYLPPEIQKSAYKSIAVRLSWKGIDALFSDNISIAKKLRLLLNILRYSPYKATVGYFIKR